MIITADIDYTYTDTFTDPLSLRDFNTGRESWGPPSTMLYPIEGYGVQSLKLLLKNNYIKESAIIVILLVDVYGCKSSVGYKKCSISSGSL